VLEHLDDDVLALEKMREMCNRYLLVSVPGGKLDDNGRTNGHFRHYTEEDLVQKMQNAGYKVIRSFTCGWPVHSLFYRQLMRRLPRSTTNRVGLGAYGPGKRALMSVADFAYRFNLSVVGTEIIAIGVPDETVASGNQRKPTHKHAD